MHNRKLQPTICVRAFLGLLAMTMLAAPSAWAVDSTWNVASGNWSLATNWMPSNHTPNDSTNDNATINTGTSFVDGNFAVHNFTLTGGTLDGAGSLSVSNTFNWSGGVMQGAGTVSLGSSATMNVTNTSDSFLFRNIDNSGTINWSSTAHFFTGMGAVLTNSGTVNFSADSQISFDGPLAAPMMTINNSNLLEKSAGTGSTVLSEIVNNTGTITAHTGTLDLNAGGESHSGSIFNIDANATLQLSNGAYTMDSGTIINEAANGNFNVTGALQADASLLSGKNLQMNGVELAINGDLDTDQFAWNSGVLSGTGTTKLQSNQTMTGAWGVEGGRTLDTNGHDFNFTANALYGNFSALTFGLPGAGTIDNSVGSTFTVSVVSNIPATPSVADLGINGDSTKLIFNNSGIFLNSTDEVRVWAQMNNDGNINMGSGTTLSLMGGGTSTGSFTVNNSVSSHGTLNFLGTATHTLSSTSQITGNGDIVFDADETDLSGKINSTGTVTAGPTDANAVLNLKSGAQVETPQFTLAGGTMNVQFGSSLQSANLIINAGTANVDGSVTAPVGGSTTVNSQGTLHLTSGTDTTPFHAGAYSQTGTLHLDGGTLAVTGQAMVPGGAIYGNGTIDGDLSIAGGGSILPSDINLPEDIEEIFVTHTITMDSSSSLVFELDANTKGADLLDAGVGDHLNSAQLSIVLFGDPSNLSPSDVFTILSSGGTIDGTLNTLNADPNLVEATDSDGNPVATFSVTYNTGSVVLRPVPEPAIALLLALGGALLRRPRTSARD
jgi:hypothetical protein